MTDRAGELATLCRELLKRYGLPESRPDPFALANALDVRVRFFPLGTLKGFYVVLNEIPFIALDRDLPEELQRIVCAHELGHHVLHRELASRTVFNEYEMYQMETQLERDANLFAACLLLPDSAVEAFRRPENRGLSVREAAGNWGVSEELLAIRLRAAGLDTDVLISRFPA